MEHTVKGGQSLVLCVRKAISALQSQPTLYHVEVEVLLQQEAPTVMVALWVHNAHLQSLHTTSFAQMDHTQLSRMLLAVQNVLLVLSVPTLHWDQLSVQMGHTVRQEPPTALNVLVDTAVRTNQLIQSPVHQEALGHQEALNANHVLLALTAHLMPPPPIHPVHRDHMLTRHPPQSVRHVLQVISVRIQHKLLSHVKMGLSV